MPRPAVPLVPSQVLADAAMLFQTKGYHNTRMQDIAALHGVTSGALYYHFSGKQDILGQLNIAAMEDLLQRASRIAAHEAEPEVRLGQLLYMHTEWVAEHAALAASLFDFDGELELGTLRSILDMRHEYTQIFRATYTEAVQTGAAVDMDPRVAIALLFGTVNWVYRWYTPGGDLTPAELAQQAVNLLSGGYISRLASLEPLSTLA